MTTSSDLIAEIHCWKVRLPFAHGAPAPMFAGRRRTTIDSCWIEVRLANGLSGWGEAYAADLDAVVAIIQNRVAPLFIGRTPRDETLGGAAARTLHNLGRSGPVLHALSGMDIALWDLRARLEGVGLHVLLGGKRRDGIRSYASLLQYYDDADAIRRNVERALREGWHEIKLHERSLKAGRAAREVMPAGAPLMMDTNCAWTAQQSIEATRQMLECKPLWIEEPIWPPEDADALMALRHATGAMVAAGENASSLHELCRFARDGVADWIQPSAIKAGGVTALMEVARECKASNRTRFSPQTAFFGPGFLATLHVLATLEADVSIERLFCELKHDPFANLLRRERDVFVLPTGAGLGFEPDRDALARASADTDFNQETT
ncbi:mandelate racemase/muconate lactonizing enzyme family protein [Hydrogenophaga sp.]|uniref:mandelate racemase/muconate lactonizing enzyme family protein n=1 Tax=Hydrogenophaga sp. TaxID=1904254 RepID=UPI002FC597B1